MIKFVGLSFLVTVQGTEVCRMNWGCSKCKIISIGNNRSLEFKFYSVSVFFVFLQVDYFRFPFYTRIYPDITGVCVHLYMSVRN